VVELTRQKIVRYYVLAAANSGLSTGEQRQLCWGDMQLETHTVNSKDKNTGRLAI